jgi:hypothetical protein
MEKILEFKRLNGIENWTLTPSQQEYLIISTEDLLKNHTKEWFKVNQKHRQEELESIFKEIVS